MRFARSSPALEMTGLFRVREVPGVHQALEHLATIEFAGVATKPFWGVARWTKYEKDSVSRTMGELGRGWLRGG